MYQAACFLLLVQWVSRRATYLADVFCCVDLQKPVDVSGARDPYLFGSVQL